MATRSTPNFKTVVQEIVNQPGWVSGNALVVIFRGTAGTAIRKAFSQDGNAGAAASITIEYQEPAPTIVGPQDLPICLPPALVPNRSETDLATDCTDRVAADAVGTGRRLRLSVGLSLRPAGECRELLRFPQVGRQAAMRRAPRSRWTSPTTARTSIPRTASRRRPTRPATSRCVVANSPLSAEVFGRRTTCAVSGTAHVEVGDESKNPHADRRRAVRR